MVFAVIGGDMRTALLCGLLAGDGHEVRAFALEKAERPGGAFSAPSAGDAARGADCVILPLPVCVQRGFLNAPLSSGEYEIADILGAITPGTTVCAGRVDPETQSLAEKQGLAIIDYFKREELAVGNVIATAEGALGIIMRETLTTVCGSRALVVGFGRIGKVLSHRLRSLGAEVTVSSRKYSDMAWCEIYGYKTLNTNFLEGHLGNYDIIVNTVPAAVLGENHLLEIRRDALCLDLASKPGGIDFAAASRIGVRVIWALSLPGEVAPQSAGGIIRDTIYNILAEKEPGAAGGSGATSGSGAF